MASPQPHAGPPPTPEPAKASPPPAAGPVRYVPAAPVEIVAPSFVKVPVFGSDREVRVIVEVDATGRVTGATPEPGQEPRLLYLANQALTAARQSRFRPAQLNGRNVPSKVVIRYRVKAGGS
jgi:hypothetical protein